MQYSKLLSEVIMNNKFESQSETIVEQLIRDKHITREEALKMWFRSQTYKEILERDITYISAMRAYTELEMERTGDTKWMKNSFE